VAHLFALTTAERASSLLLRLLPLSLHDGLMVSALRMHAVNNAGILRLQRAHVILRGLDRVRLRQLVPVIGPFLLL